MTHGTPNRMISMQQIRCLCFLAPAASIFFCFTFLGCSSIGELLPSMEREKTTGTMQSAASLKPADFDVALRTNQAALTDGKHSPDIALYNIGVLSSNPANPKKDLGKALLSFKKLVSAYPHSPRAEPARAWIQVLEEHQRITEEKQKLAEEKRTLMRDRESLSQEREKLKYVIEKSRQIDAEIENKRRQTRIK